VTADTALLLGKTGAMNAAALVRHSKRDIADSGHKILVRLMFSGATLYSFFISRQAKPLILSKKLFNGRNIRTYYRQYSTKQPRTVS
jgi:hypothetical protein